MVGIILCINLDHALHNIMTTPTWQTSMANTKFPNVWFLTKIYYDKNMWCRTKIIIRKYIIVLFGVGKLWPTKWSKNP